MGHQTKVVSRLSRRRSRQVKDHRDRVLAYYNEAAQRDQNLARSEALTKRCWTRTLLGPAHAGALGRPEALWLQPNDGRTLADWRG